MAPVRVAVVDQHEIVVAGLTTVLGLFPDRVQLEHRPGVDVDIVLYGVRSLGGGHDQDLHQLLRGSPGTVIALAWRPDDPAVELALRCGAHGVLSLQLAAEPLVAGIEELVGARDRMPCPPVDGHCHPAVDRAGLTPREIQVLGLVGTGLRNWEIGQRLLITENTVATHLRNAYKKIGVTRRSQAVLWAGRHGLVDMWLSSPAPATDSDNDAADHPQA